MPSMPQGSVHGSGGDLRPERGRDGRRNATRKGFRTVKVSVLEQDAKLLRLMGEEVHRQNPSLRPSHANGLRMMVAAFASIRGGGEVKTGGG